MSNTTKQNRNKYDSREMNTTMGISLSVEQHDVLKKYAKQRKSSVSKLILDSLNFNAMKRALGEPNA